MTQLARHQPGDRLHDGRRHEVVRGTAPDGRPVILKVLKQLHPPPAQVARFRHEFERLAAVSSEHVASAIALETDPRRWALVQDDFGGQALAAQLTCDLSLAERLTIAVAVARGMRDIHARNTVHKDINPSNTVRNPATGEVKLIDFGISTALSSERPVFSNRGRLEGRLHCLSPEQTGRVSAAVDHRSDLYSFGATLYELFSGRASVPERRSARARARPHRPGAAEPPLLVGVRRGPRVPRRSGHGRQPAVRA